MKKGRLNTGNVFLLTALILLLVALVFGILAAIIYVSPEFLKSSLGFQSLRPMHVSAALFWIILGASGCVYNGLAQITDIHVNATRAKWQWALWMIAIIGIYYSYTKGDFGGREYWEFNPIWALPIVLAWLLFITNFIAVVKKIKQWPVYMWMWLTGLIFFLFSFLENYLWIFPYFRMHFITDTTVQWKVNGSLVGAWNQILYGTAFFLMDKLEGKNNTSASRLAFVMYFLGLSNLMFNWGHHIYTLPTEKYIRYFGYIVSMTEWIFFLKIIYDWRKNLDTVKKHYHYFPYRFLMASEAWVFLNLLQAILMSIPAINVFTHGTHITVAHAMGTTIGINSMILLAACFEFLHYSKYQIQPGKIMNISFWILQISLLVFWLSLNGAGIQKGIWQISSEQSSYSKMMGTLQPYFKTLLFSGIGIAIAIGMLVSVLISKTFKHSLYHPSDLN